MAKSNLKELDILDRVELLPDDLIWTIALKLPDNFKCMIFKQVFEKRIDKLLENRLEKLSNNGIKNAFYQYIDFLLKEDFVYIVMLLLRKYYVKWLNWAPFWEPKTQSSYKNLIVWLYIETAHHNAKKCQKNINDFMIEKGHLHNWHHTYYQQSLIDYS